MRFAEFLESQLSGQVAYHGTNQQFNSFNLNAGVRRDWGDFGLGVYLSPTPTLASRYAEYAVQRYGGGKPVVLRCRLNVANTANFDDAKLVQQVSQATGVPFPKAIVAGQPQSRPRTEAIAIAQYMTEQGYDSATGQNGMEIVVYDPNKVRIEGVEEG